MSQALPEDSKGQNTQITPSTSGATYVTRVIPSRVITCGVNSDADPNANPSDRVVEQ